MRRLARVLSRGRKAHDDLRGCRVRYKYAFAIKNEQDCNRGMHLATRL